MIWSVSTLARSITAAAPLTSPNGVMARAIG
jgi:hypothetical protein